MAQTSAHCHKLVAAVAKEAAGQLYERLMGDNWMYEQWKFQFPGLNSKQLERAFIARQWGKCIPFARATLAVMLNNPGVPEQVKEDIVEALALDATLVKGRQNPAKIMGTVH